jgi:hypothetical protein
MSAVKAQGRLLREILKVGGVDQILSVKQLYSLRSALDMI